MVDALVELGKRLGVEYRLSTPISKVTLSADGSRATGVVLSDGETMTADVVINNTDLVYAYNNLLPKTAYAESLAQRPASCSSISFYWALDRKVPQLEAHNIFLADEYRESFDSIFKKHLIPNEPSFYVNVPSRVDASAAPEGKETVVVLVPVGHLLDTDTAGFPDPTADMSTTANGKSADVAAKLGAAKGSGIVPTTQQDWPQMVALARRTILSTIQARTGVDLGPLIVHEASNDPSTWRTRFNLDKGAILGLSHSFFNVLSFRPATRARRGGWLDGKLGGGVLGRVGEVLSSGGDIKDLYMVGASAHPGTGVPICLAGGKMVAEQVCMDLGVHVPWTVGEGEKVEAEKKGLGRDIDRARSGPLLDSFQYLVIALLVALVAALLMLVR